MEPCDLFSIVDLWPRVSRTKQPEEWRQHPLCVAHDPKGVRKVAIDRGRVCIDSDVLRGRLDAPVRCLITSETDTDADEEIGLRDKILESWKCCEMPKAPLPAQITGRFARSIFSTAEVSSESGGTTGAGAEGTTVEGSIKLA